MTDAAIAFVNLSRARRRYHPQTMSDPETGDSERDHGRWVSIYTCRSREEANLAIAMLRDQGIAARVDGEEMSVVGLGWFSSAGAVSPLNARVQVLEADATTARAMLDDVDRRRVARLSRLPCPKCGAIKPDRVWPGPRLAAMAGVVISFALLCTGVTFWAPALLACASVVGVFWPMTPWWRCTSCRHVWVAPDPGSELDDDDEADAEAPDEEESDEQAKSD
jgi:hypothetical protein